MCLIHRRFQFLLQDKLSFTILFLILPLKVVQLQIRNNQIQTGKIMALVFKFGGASLKDADSVRNMADIVASFSDNIIIVVSAMGKTTKALHKLATGYFYRDESAKDIEEFWAYHNEIIENLGIKSEPELMDRLNWIKEYLIQKLSQKPSESFDFEYDQIVCIGELISSVIVNQYLKKCNIKNQWIDIRQSLKTDNVYRDSRINWEISEDLVLKNFDFSKDRIFLTQGFIASDQDNNSTTLGLEGSDYTAAALAYFINAEKMVVWKDVAGFFNSDPNEFENVVKLDAISYREAVELAYYGAKIIHPKTIKPLENKNIPLWVKSFKEPDQEGTVITLSTHDKSGVVPMVPVYITKNSQILISIAPNDFSFIAEYNLEHIFSILARYRIRVNLMQNSAISFSVCVDYDEEKIIPAIRELNNAYKVLFNKDLTLVTIRHFNEEIVKQIVAGKEVLVQQKSRNMIRLVVR